MIRVMLALGVLALAGALSCYKGDGPPCTPSSFDWPGCRHPTDPPMASHDGGADR